MRKRTRNSFSYGSMWMSDAPRLMASVRMRLHSLTTGASSAESASCADVHLLVFLEDLEVGALLRLKVFHDLLQLERRGGAVVPVDGRLDPQLGGHDRLDVVAGHELDVVHGEDVRRIGHGDGDRGAGLVDRKDVVLPGDVAGDQLDDARVDLEVLEIDRRHAELLAETLGDVLFRDEAELDQRFAELAAGLLLDAKRFLELILGDQARFGEQLTETNTHTCFLRLLAGRAHR